ncbi:lipoate--protein ligase [Malacoplasma penetrans]|uniref:lipoate--protein ligase n=1 Tax=Malacoplasma penetrans (strain HF-2) TaxID=272633 RepID=Q8EUQ5_MALP2|nr:lipoate--protein ligase [Malacoplasma penetrans]RXY97071.1 lipoate--protein ligase [Malacoplasma penetrans]BAC44657.1 lipoate protein ligase A [Malacoplasma penetrans HF-2]
MKIIKLTSNNPSINLSSEYFYLTNQNYKDDDIFLFWKNKNTIVIGKNQSYANEVNQIYANEINAKIVRRMSGGGAVFQDDGNICFTFIKRNQKSKFNFKDCLYDIVEFLNSVNIKAEFSGRNDIIVNGKKISGNAVMFHKDDYLIHGTLLFNVDVEKMVRLLTVDKSKLISKGVESVRSRVENICNLTSIKQDEFENQFLSFLENKYQTKQIIEDLSNNEDVKKLDLEKFNNKDWIFGRDFEFNYQNKIRIENGLLEIKLQTENNIIKDIKLNSDGLFCFDLETFENLFINQQYNIEVIKNIANNFNLNEILEGLTPNNIVELFFNNI